MAKNDETPPKVYDKIIKENLEAILLPLTELLLGIQVQSSEKLTIKLQTTLEREPDFIRKVETPEGDIFILHLEFQSSDESHMIYRMKEYEAILSKMYRIPIKQFVVYLGEGISKMHSQLVEEEVFRGFELVNISSMNVERLLEKEMPEAIILAILGNYDRAHSPEILRRILFQLRYYSKDETQLRKYLIHLQELSRLRNLVEETHKSIQEMPITYDIKEDFLYNKGKKEAKKDQQNHVITQGVESGLDLDLIAKLVGLTIDEVKERIQELGLAG